MGNRESDANLTSERFLRLHVLDERERQTAATTDSGKN
jgi:hypothetical protein